MNLSTYWDLENNKGKLIIHDNEKLMVSYHSNESNQRDFNNWVFEATRFIKLN